MSPIRPALGFVHPRPPKPAAVRAVHCPYCNHYFEPSQRAQTLTCPKCTQRLQFDDKVLHKQSRGEVATVGHVRITAASSLTGQIVCGHLINNGRFEGSAIVHGALELDPHSTTTGEIRARSLHAPPGATLRGKITIGPTHGEGLRPVVTVKGPAPKPPAS